MKEKFNITIASEDMTYRALMIGNLKTRYDILMKKIQEDFDNMTPAEHQELLDVSREWLEFERDWLDTILKENE
jgi:hypothetical protein